MVAGSLKTLNAGTAHEFGERAMAADADADRIHAQVSPAGATVAAHAAGDMTFRRDAVADRKAFDFAAALDNFPAEFVADSGRYRDGSLRPVVPLEYVDVGAANRHCVLP